MSKKKDAKLKKIAHFYDEILVLSHDGTKCCLRWIDNSVVIADVKTGQCLHILQGHKDVISHVTLTGDNTKAISSSWDKTLKVWDINTGQCLQTIGTFTYHHPVIHKNLVAHGSILYRFEDYQDIINAKPQPKPGSKIGNPNRLIDGSITGAAAGLIKLQALRENKIAMGQSPKTLKDKFINAAYALKNHIDNAYKRFSRV